MPIIQGRITIVHLDSDEFQPGNIVLQPPDLVQALYRSILGREADPGGLELYTSKLAHNTKLENVVTDLLGSDEFRHKGIAALSADLVTAAYTAILGRPPDRAGFEAHQSRLIHDRDVAGFLSGMINSEEFRQAFWRQNAERQARTPPVALPTGEAKLPSIIFTHHKCASTWLVHLLGQYCAAFNKPFFTTHFSAVIPPEERHFDVLLFTNSEYHFCTRSYQPWLDSGRGLAVHVIRNPLDIVVSAYYSHLATHSVAEWPELVSQRETLRNLDKTSGMLATWTFLERSDFDNGIVGPLYALRRWNYSDPRIKTLRMEDLVANPEFVRSELRSLLEDDPSQILSELTFEKLSGGRATGVVDNESHYRSGKPQQWIHEMDAPLARAIYQAYRGIIDAYYPDVQRLLTACPAPPAPDRP